MKFNSFTVSAIIFVVVIFVFGPWSHHSSSAPKTRPTTVSSQPSTQECIVNGFGNQLCGDAAVAYCHLRLQDTPADDPSYDNIYQTCSEIGVRQ